MHALNPHAFIAARNIDAAFASSPMTSNDARMLARLSADAVPAIAKRWDKITPENRAVIAKEWDSRYGTPVTYGNERFFNVLGKRGLDWRAWTVSEARVGGWLAYDGVERARAQVSPATSAPLTPAR